MIDANMVLKAIEFKRNPLDCSSYIKPNKQINEEFQLERLKHAFVAGTLSLADYMYASHLPVIDYIPEWLVNEEESELNSAVCNLSLNNDHSCHQIIGQLHIKDNY